MVDSDAGVIRAADIAAVEHTPGGSFDPSSR
jgi:hypothetical protein